MTEIVPGIFLGEYKKEPIGYDAIVSVITKPPDYFYKFDKDMRYHINIEDDDYVDIFIYLENFIEWVTKLLAQNKKIYIHCHYCQSRSPTFIVAYLIHVGYSYNDAMQLLLDKRPNIAINNTFAMSLLIFSVWDKKRSLIEHRTLMWGNMKNFVKSIKMKYVNE